MRKFKNSNGWQKLWVVFTNFCLFFYKAYLVSIASSSNNEKNKENDEKYYDKIARDMNNSIFWNAKKDSREKAQVELEKKPLLQPDKFTNKINEQNVDDNNNNNSNVNITTSWSYPEKIKVPSANRGTNVIYKVKDCYYDSNGDFLYRVPGMIN